MSARAGGPDAPAWQAVDDGDRSRQADDASVAGASDAPAAPAAHNGARA
ncbi:hypothetical protein NCC78_17360 [Micromonospora phytophila]|nr:hypothetical protein [Micromonospora phytophila]MCM0676441.1 hypothetical protein [Micromonospora phytophila]